MKNRILLLLWLAAAGAVFAQATITIEKTEISGVSEDKLSSALRADMAKFAGQAYNAQAAAQFAERIQSELPEYVATPTTAPGTQPDRVALVFVVAHNINAKYVVESVGLNGIDRAKLSDELWADMQKMVGHPVDDSEADRLRDRLLSELKAKKINSHVSRSVVKGDQPQHVKILYEGHSQNSIGFGFSNPSYHSREKFSGELLATYTWFGITGIQLEGINDADQLIERSAGYRSEYWVEHKRIRASLDYSSFRAQWNAGTLAAAKANPVGNDLYRLHDTIEPSVKFTVTPNVHITVGVAASQLQMQRPTLHFESVRTATGSLDYVLNLSKSGNYLMGGSYKIHTAGDRLGSAETYTRHLWDQSFSFWKRADSPPTAPGIAVDAGKERVTVAFKLGRITGNAPMYERFSMGQINTLRGWNKYEITPLGGSRIAYGSITYGHRYGSVFYENGAVWDNGQPKVLRKSIGGTLHLDALLHANPALRFPLLLMTPGIGVPITGSHKHPVFTVGASW